jgi:hypothetical protein
MIILTIIIVGSFLLQQYYYGNDFLYLIALAVIFIALYLRTKNLTTALWSLFLVSFLFFKPILYLEEPSYQPLLFKETENQELIKKFYVNFSDVILVAVIYMLARNRQQHSIKISTSSTLSLLGILIFAFISAYHSNYFSIAFFYSIQLMKLLCIFLISKILFESSHLKNIFFQILFSFSLYNSALIFKQKLSGGPTGLITELNPWSSLGRYADEINSLYRPGGFTADPNLIATIFGMTIPLALAFVLNKNTFSKTYLWVTIFVSSVALVLTASRAVWVFTAILCFLVYRKYRSLNVAQPLWLVKHIKTIFIVALLVCIPLLGKRLLTIRSAFDEQGGAVYRLQHIALAIKMGTQNVFGVGLGTFQYELSLSHFDPKTFTYDISPPHNVFAEVLSGMGVFGLLSFVSFQAFALRETANDESQYLNQKHAHPGVVYAMIAYVLAANFYPWLFKHPVTELYWILLGIPVITHKTKHV